MFEYKTVIKLHDTDAAGLLFFANQFKIAHDAYQAFLEHLNIPFASIINERDFLIPIVHAESDYKRPLVVSDVIRIQLTVDAIGNSSFTLRYDLFRNNDELVGTAKTVHVSIDGKTKKKIELPESLKRLLEKNI